jgi:hypothetical protein
MGIIDERTTSMRRIGLRSLLVTGAMVLMLATGANANIINLTATLTGGQETPPNSSPGTGHATFVLDDAALTLTTEGVTFSGLTTGVVAAHIHAPGPPGVSAPIVHPYDTASVAGLTSGTFATLDVWSATSSPALTPALVSDIEAGNTYINIHTTQFPAGEIRGQLVPEPSSLAMGATAVLFGLGFAWRRRSRKRTTD